MIVTDDIDIAKRTRHLTTQAKSDLFEYDHDDIGFNYRLTNLQAAIGVAQMERLSEFIEIKRRNAVLYRSLLNNIQEVEFLWEKAFAESNFWFYTLKIPPKHKAQLMEFLISNGIQVRPVWKLIHTLPMYQNCQTYRIENAFHAYENCINLPCSVSLEEEEIRYIVRSIKRYFAKLR